MKTTRLFSVLMALCLSIGMYAAENALCSGDKGHFATPTNYRMHYEIITVGTDVTFTVTPYNAARVLDFAEIQITGVGNYAMTKVDEGKSYTYTLTGRTAEETLYVRFLYSDDEIGGNEMTAETQTATDANIIAYIVGTGCGEIETPAEPDPVVPACSGNKGHFGTPDNYRISYEINYVGTDVVFTVTPYDATNRTLDFAELQIIGIGNYAMTIAADGKSASYTLAGRPINEVIYFRFLYSDDQLPGNEMTSQDLSNTDANICAYKVGESAVPQTYSWCYATTEQLTTAEGSAYLTWTTAANGDVIITIDNATFRNGGFENKDGSWDASWNVLSGEGLATVESASVYFNAGTLSADNTTYTITKKADATLPEGAVLQFAGHAFSWSIGEAGLYFLNPNMKYTYGFECAFLDAPTNVAVTDAGVITFTEVADAEKYIANIYQGTTLVDSEEVTNGATLSYKSYVAGTFTVKVIATANGKSDSPESEGASWNLQASPLPASKFCSTLADAITANNGYCSPLFTIQTQENGNVTIVISAGEGNDGETMFRGTTGMKGTFKLNGSEPDFAAYFDRAKTDDYTYTLSLKDAANKPALGAVISYAGMIEARSSIHGDDWSNYQLDGYLYGTICPTDVAVEGVTLDQTEVTLPYNRTLTLRASIKPANAVNKEVTWKSSNPEVATVADGVVTPVAQEGTTTITVTTVDGGFTATCIVTLAPVKYAEPNVAAPVPTVDANLVKSIYSDTYTSLGYAFGNWANTHAQKELDINGDSSRVYTGATGNFFGIQFTAINAISMKYLHLDVWAENDQAITIVPIYQVPNADGTGLVNGTEYGKSVELKGQQWNTIKFELAVDFAQVTDWTSVYQIKFDALNGLTIALDNIYFSTDPIEDSAVPTAVTATLASVSYTSAVLTCQAEDNSGAVSFDVYDGEKKVASGGAESGKPATIAINGLEAGKEYTLAVEAYDQNGNKAARVEVKATTVAFPAAATAPTVEEANVYAIYSDAYTTLHAPVEWNQGWWANPTMQSIKLGEDNAILYTSSGAAGGCFGWTFSTTFDLTGYTTLHYDVYPEATGTVHFGITRRPEGTTDVKKVFDVTGGQWNHIALDLTGQDLTQIYQLGFWDFASVKSFILDNVYFEKVEKGPATALDNTELNNIEVRKVLENGQVYIIRNGEKYNVMGIQVK